MPIMGGAESTNEENGNTHTHTIQMLSIQISIVVRINKFPFLFEAENKWEKTHIV